MTFRGLVKDLRKVGYIYCQTLPLSLAGYVTRRWKGEPLWLLIVAPPSSGKTLTLSLLNGLPEVVTVSSLTPASLITAMGGHEEDRSLLAKVDNCLLIVKDFGTILSSPWESCSQILAILREAYDGYVSKDFASLRREYKLHFNILGASTSFADTHRQLHVQLGERFLRARPAPVAIPRGWKMDVKEAKKLLASYICDLDFSEPKEREVGAVDVEEVAALTSILRSEVAADNNGQIWDMPEHERPFRLERQLDKLWKGLFAATLSVKIANDLTKQVAFDTLPRVRREILTVLYREGTLTTSEIRDRIVRIGDKAVKKELVKMRALGIVESGRTEGWSEVWRMQPSLSQEIEDVFGGI